MQVGRRLIQAGGRLQLRGGRTLVPRGRLSPGGGVPATVGCRGVGRLLQGGGRLLPGGVRSLASGVCLSVANALGGTDVTAFVRRLLQ